MIQPDFKTFSKLARQGNLVPVYDTFTADTLTPVSAYQRIAQDAGVASRVLFVGSTDQVERIYAASDALLLPTPYDAFAMVVSEAMASAMPVVVSREAGASELIQHGVNGLLLQDVTSVDELAGNMRRLAEDPGRAAEMGRTARKSVVPLSWDAVAERTMRVYEQLLRNPN